VKKLIIKRAKKNQGSAVKKTSWVVRSEMPLNVKKYRVLRS